MQEFKFYLEKELNKELLKNLCKELRVSYKYGADFFAQGSQYPLGNIRKITKKDFINFKFPENWDEYRIDAFLTIVRVLDRGEC